MSSSSPNGETAVSAHVIAVLICCVAVVGGQGMMVSPLLPDIAHGLETGVAEIGYALGTYGLATAVSAFAAARFLDRIPRRKAMMAAMTALALGLALSASAGNAYVLAGGQIVAGAAAGIVLPAIYAYAGDVAPPDQRSQLVGRVLLGWSIALVAAIPAGGFLGGIIGWRGVFATMGILAVAGALAAFSLPRAPRTATPPPSYAASLGIRGIRWVLFASLANMTGFYAMYSYLGAAIRAEHGGGSALAAWAVLAYGIGFTLAQPLGKRIDRLGAVRSMIIAMAVLSAIFVLLPRSLAVFPLFCVVIGALGVVQHVALNTAFGDWRISRRPPWQRAFAQYGGHLSGRDDRGSRHGTGLRARRVCRRHGFQQSFAGACGDCSAAGLARTFCNT